jgi:hypothetical protein
MSFTKKDYAAEMEHAGEEEHDHEMETATGQAKLGMLNGEDIKGNSGTIKMVMGAFLAPFAM